MHTYILNAGVCQKKRVLWIKHTGLEQIGARWACGHQQPQSVSALKLASPLFSFSLSPPILTHHRWIKEETDQN